MKQGSSQPRLNAADEALPKAYFLYPPVGMQFVLDVLRGIITRAVDKRRISSFGALCLPG
jgi:hypothetical protein